MRLSARLALLVVLAGTATGCSRLAPSLFAPSRLAPDVVPATDGSAVVATARAATGGLAGRAIDRDTGAPVVGLLVRSGDQQAVSDINGAFALPTAGTRLAGGYPGYLSFDAALGTSGDGTRATAVLILLAQDPAATETVVQRAP